MSYRQGLKNLAKQSPQQLLTVWRQERSFRVGKTLCYSGLILASVATVADLFWSDPYVIATDFVLLFGTALSLYWIHAPSRPNLFWWPLFWALWISALPSFWSTGGLNSPFFGVGLAALYVISAVMDSKNHSLGYLIFAFLHIPAFFFIEGFYPLSVENSQPLAFTAIITGAVLATVFVCVHGLLKAEQELSLEFTEHYQSLLKAEEDLKKREMQLREAQSIANVGSWEWDLDADLISWSDELFKIFDVKKEEFDPSFKAYLARLKPELRNKVHSIIQHSLETGEDFSFENNVRTSKGERYMFSRGRAVANADGRIVKMLGTTQDISDRKRIEAQLIEARLELEKRVEERTLQLAESLKREKTAKELAQNANQAKMQFLANMSHEIRTPINSILGFSEILASEKPDAKEMENYLGRIRSNGKQLLHLINDILDLSKFEAGHVPVQKAPTCLKTLIDNVVSSFSPSLKEKGLELKLNFLFQPTEKILTDAERVSQILTNLLSNSIKFSEKGVIRLTISHQQLEELNKINLTIDVEDNGIGISPENQSLLFQPFSQGDASIARKFGGSGLGLSLSKKIAEALGGKLELKQSTPGKGSHFSFRLPVRLLGDTAELSEPDLTERLDPALFNGKKILLVEDSVDNAALISHYMQSYVGDIDVVTDGLQALTAAFQKPYDCILMDIQMPGMDGLEATRKIRVKGFKKPIVALTAHALPTEAARSLEAGCTLHLTKPITQMELIGSLGRLLKDGQL